MKKLFFVGSALDDLREFPSVSRREAGHQLMQVQNGLDPDDWKSMISVGKGVREIRIYHKGAFRIIHVAKFEEGVYVLHAFQKKTQKTTKKDLDLARSRFKEIQRSRS